MKSQFMLMCFKTDCGIDEAQLLDSVRRRSGMKTGSQTLWSRVQCVVL